MFYEYKFEGDRVTDLKREFEAAEEAAKLLGIKLYCRDLVQLLKPTFVHQQDPTNEFFLSCFEHNGLPYKAYTTENFVREFYKIMN